MRPWIVLLALLPACGDDDPKGVDAAPDVQYGSFIKVTLAASDVPIAPQMWTTNVDIDTDTSMLCKAPKDGAYCMVTATDMTLANGVTLRGHGSKPLVLLATGKFDLEGTIDVSSKRDAAPGAGAALAASCLSTMPATVNSGGFGGSFMGKGGDGGAVDGNKGVAAPALTARPMTLRGGCPGGSGSTATAGVAAGTGGAGGGVVDIIASTITVNGTINASGAGGGGGPAQKSGGGGGGSGGMIVLDVASPQDVTAGSNQAIWLYANGGGGGQGGTGGTVAGSGPGEDGQDPSNPAVQALGGRNTSRDGGRGGLGSAGSVQLSGGDQALSPANNGGGGAGGGGAGFIHAPDSLQAHGALVAPSATYP